ncbi:hypothetical protein TNIN_312501 [Trichonephila inaurata madagascariensis]|uniref:Uncharacterized protein n=1 Tax=Trichonephila inaurata madagascariensis TaxID=2747483 RepID=A0A8X6WXL0_9ARAC|nr:hypothetical protein TNIN_312501 [Trichonephila inaurata madagascariensis]
MSNSSILKDSFCMSEASECLEVRNQRENNGENSKERNLIYLTYCQLLVWQCNISSELHLRLTAFEQRGSEFRDSIISFPSPSILHPLQSRSLKTIRTPRLLHFGKLTIVLLTLYLYLNEVLLLFWVASPVAKKVRFSDNNKRGKRGESASLEFFFLLATNVRVWSFMY